MDKKSISTTIAERKYPFRPMKMLKKIGKWLGITLLILLVGGGSFFLLYVRPVLNHMMQMHVVPIDKNLTIVEGGGGNSGVLLSDSLVLVVDTKMKDAAKKFGDSVKNIAGNRPILVVNTHDHPDHTGGNELFKTQTIVAAGRYTPEGWKKEAGEATLPNKWLDRSMTIRMDDDTVEIFTYNINAHTAGDVFVYFKKRKMLFGGDVILNKQVPSVQGVADPDGYLAIYDSLQKQFDIRTIVPGHGTIGGTEIIDTMRQYFHDMKIAARDDSKRGLLVAKYKDWIQVPMLMAPEQTIKAIKKKSE